MPQSKFDLKTTTSHLKQNWPLLPAMALYVTLAIVLDYTQDDAYITYRYVANFLSGDGLVYNIGQYMEGITNHGWAIFLSLCGALGGDYISISKIVGFIFGGMLVVGSHSISRSLAGKPFGSIAWLAPYLTAASLALAYWAPAGMETTAFAWMVIWSLLLWLKRSRLLPLPLALAVFLRPEGALVAGLLIIIDAVVERRLPKAAIRASVIAFIVSLPMVVFKYLYYGSILPNSFHAKTAWDFAQVQSGFDYALRFFGDHLILLAGLAIPLLFYRQLSAAGRKVFLFSIIFTVYIIIIGGDVLEVYRFFVPLLPLLAALVAWSVGLAIKKIKRQKTMVMVAMVAVIAAIVYLTIPFDYVKGYRDAGLGLNRKMKFLAEKLKENDPKNFSVALTTIGAFGYELVGHTIIDMIGLTDTMVSRHPEEPIPGMRSDWREKKYNAGYVLSRQPDYIVFSTGVKPTAASEKALFLYSQFIECYRTVAWRYKARKDQSGAFLTSVWVRRRPVTGKLAPTHPFEYAELYFRGINLYNAGQLEASTATLDSAIRLSPQPYLPQLIYRKAYNFHMLQRYDVATLILDNLLKYDSLVFDAHKDLYLYEVLFGDSTKAQIHKSWIKRLAPWYWPFLDSLTQEAIRINQSGQ